MRSHLSVFAALLLPLFLFTSPGFGDSLKSIGDFNNLIYSPDQQLYWTWEAYTWEQPTPYPSKTWEGAIQWAEELTHGGFNDWRLPILPNNTSGNSELSYLFSQLANYSNPLVPKLIYWTGTISSTGIDTIPAAWQFDLLHGTQFLATIKTSIGGETLAYALAVRSAVPEPASALLFLSGLTGTLWYLRRKKR